MFTPAVNLDVPALKTDLKPLANETAETKATASDSDFSKTLESVLHADDKKQNTVLSNSDGNPSDVKKPGRELTEEKEAGESSDVSQQDMLVMLQQLMMQMHLAGSAQALKVLKQDNAGQAVASPGQDMLTLSQVLKELQGLVPANKDTSKSDVVNGEALSEIGNQKILDPQSVLNSGSKINLNDFKTALSDAGKKLSDVGAKLNSVMSDAGKNLSDVETKLNPGLTSEKGNVSLDSMSLVTGEGDKVLFKADKIKADLPVNDMTAKDGNNLAAMAGSGNHTADSKNTGSSKEAAGVSRLNEIDVPIMKTLSAGGRHLVVNIDPPDLGSVRIKLSLDNGVLRADFKVDSGNVKDMFTSSFSQIKTSLENSGFKVGEFHVNVRDDNNYPDGRRQKPDDEQHQRQQQKQRNGPKSDFFELFA